MKIRLSWSEFIRQQRMDPNCNKCVLWASASQMAHETRLSRTDMQRVRSSGNRIVNGEWTWTVITTNEHVTNAPYGRAHGGSMLWPVKRICCKSSCRGQVSIRKKAVAFSALWWSNNDKSVIKHTKMKPKERKNNNNGTNERGCLLSQINSLR